MFRRQSKQFEFQAKTKMTRTRFNLHAFLRSLASDNIMIFLV